MSFNFLNDGRGEAQQFTPIDTFIDPVSKIRVSQPSNLIDTDFEYGLQPTKWETVELINNTPSFFSKGGDTTIADITNITTNAGTREITVSTGFPHNLAVGIPIRVAGTKSVTADGSFIINATPSPTTFTYLARAEQPETVAIFDLYTSIITGEFFQGSQITLSSSEGIVTDEGAPSVLTIKTENDHGFGPNTPFYLLNLNSTIAQEFEAQNTSTVSFDPTNSATAQTFDGSNTLLVTPVNLSNTASSSPFENFIDTTSATNSTITVNLNNGDIDNWADLTNGSALYYDVTAGGGYFLSNPRGVVFLKTTSSVVSGNQATFQVSILPDGDPLPILANMTGFFQIADEARTFPGNNVDPATEVEISISEGAEFVFDAANEEDSVGTVQSYSGDKVNIFNSQGALDWYVGTMLLYETTGNPPTELSNNTTYFIKEINEGAQAGQYEVSIAEFPDSSSISFSTGGTGDQTFKKIGISTDKDTVHVRDSDFAIKDMVQYTFPENGNFEADEEKSFYFISKKYDQHNYELSPTPDAFIEATGGTVTTLSFGGELYTVHRFISSEPIQSPSDLRTSTPSVFQFEVLNEGTFLQEIRFVTDRGTLDGQVSTTGQLMPERTTYQVVVEPGGRVDIAYPQTSIPNEIPFATINPAPLQGTGGLVTSIFVNNIQYRVHSFVDTGSSSFNVSDLGNISENVTLDYLIVGGGGGGNTGGGGAGGYLTGSLQMENTGNYPVVVGAGGAVAANGENSSALGLTAIGGGRGGAFNQAGFAGGSGGGGGYPGARFGGSGSQGNSGGRGTSSDTGQRWAAGGGGGRGGAGGNASQSTWNSTGGAGGAGISNSIRTGTAQFYCGGGGGGNNSTGSGPGTGGSRGGLGGSGGGGQAFHRPPLGAQPGVANTGGGGGGRSRSGGSGIVVIRYPVEV